MLPSATGFDRFESLAFVLLYWGYIAFTKDTPMPAAATIPKPTASVAVSLNT